jgi:hypothetical protein
MLEKDDRYSSSTFAERSHSAMYPYFFNVPMTASGAYLGITCATNEPRTRNWDNASHLRVVEHVKLLSRVTASVENDSFLASWVIRQKLGAEKNQQ